MKVTFDANSTKIAIISLDINDCDIVEDNNCHEMPFVQTQIVVSLVKVRMNIQEIKQHVMISLNYIQADYSNAWVSSDSASTISFNDMSFISSFNLQLFQVHTN